MATTRDPVQILEDGFLQRYKQLYTSTSTKHGDSQIQQFYDGATVFITGGTGFMGKHLIEKLLRATNVAKIFILMRSKKGKSIEDRLSEMLKDPVYKLLSEIMPHYQQKLAPVAGDVSELQLGMSDNDWNIVTQQTEIIFHVAATTRFDETLRVATLTNVRGTRETLLLGTQCTKLRSFVHVSTAYSHARSDLVSNNILEQFYPSPVDPGAMIKLVETVEEARLNDMTQSFINGWPNTYTFTKAITEELVRAQGSNLPICVVRPAIVICAHREPLPGWLDMSAVYGVTGLVLAGALGVGHGYYVNRDAKISFVPVDYVSNAIVAAGWETAKQRNEKLKIYTVSSSARNGIPYGNVQDIMDESAHEYPLPNSIGCYFVLLTANPVLFFIYTWVLHIIPAYLVDGVFLLMGKKRIAVKLANKLYRLSKAGSYFSMNEWKFDDDNLVELYKKLSPIDREIFDFDIEKLDWKEYILVWGIGLRKYIIKDGLTRTEYAKKKQFVFRLIALFVGPLYFYMLYKIIYFAVIAIIYVMNVFC